MKLLMESFSKYLLQEADLFIVKGDKLEIDKGILKQLLTMAKG